MSHVRRLALATTFLIAIWVVGLTLDATLPTLFELNESHGVDEGPFSRVLVAVESTAWSIVPVMSAGVLAWLVYGSIQEERREETRRVRREP